jgi:hypothetical protein
MGRRTGLLFKSFYSESIFCFIIPEMFGSQDHVKKPFCLKRLVERLRSALPMEQSLVDFSKADPIFDFVNVVGPYRDFFWAPYWNVLISPGPPHFPFEMNYKKQLSRAIDWDALHTATQNDLKSCDSEFRCRLFPYGGLSFHLIESYEFQKECSPEDVVTLLKQPVRCDGRTVKQSQFINEIRGSVIDEIVKQKESSQLTTCSPQNVVVHPDINLLPHLSRCWDGIATLLAMSNEPRLIGKYNQESYPNYGRQGQLILFSPYASLLLTPDLAQRQDSLNCLRERTANIAELVAIQRLLTAAYKDRYDRSMMDLQSRKGRPFAELMAFMHKKLSREEFLSLNVILGLENMLSQSRWRKWASVMRNSDLEAFQQFKETIDKWNKADVGLGQDVRGTINSVLDTLQKIVKVVP